MSKEDIRGHGLTPKQVEEAKSLYPTLKSQEKVAKGLGVAKWKINLLFRKEKVSKAQPKGLAAFNKDVASAMDVNEWGRKKAFYEMKFSPKWIKRYNKQGKKDKELKGERRRKAPLGTKARDELAIWWDEQHAKRDKDKMHKYEKPDADLLASVGS